MFCLCERSLSSVSLKQILGGRNLYLIGMMGSGKSATGPHLAKHLGYGFIDADDLIEKVTKKSITEIFEEDGEQAFREIETKVMKEISRRYSLVIATGGGVVTQSENWGVLHQGIVIWLDPGKDCLLKRIDSDPIKRPLIKESNRVAFFDELMQERKPLYEEADLRIEVDKQSPDELANIIIKKLSEIVVNRGIQDAQQTTEG